MQSSIRGLCLIFFSLIYADTASAETRQPTLTLNPTHQWTLAYPKDFSALEQFIKAQGSCTYVPLWSWLIYDTQTQQIVPKHVVHQQWPQFNTMHPWNCQFSASADAIKSQLDITLPTQPGQVLIYFDFVSKELALNMYGATELAKEQAKLESLGQLITLPKYFVVTPLQGLKPQKM